MAVVLDSDAVIGFLDRGDALHPAADTAVRELIGGDSLVVSAVTYAEVLTGAHLGHQDLATVEGFFADLIADVLPVDRRVAARAADLRAARRALRMPDALIFAAADVHGDVELIVSGDVRAASLPGLDCDVRLLEPDAA